jgi:hypothetical protein
LQRKSPDEQPQECQIERFERRKLFIERIAAMGLMEAAEAGGMSPRTARKWLHGSKSMASKICSTRSSRPAKTRTSLDDALCERIEQLRRLRLPMRSVAAVVGRSAPPCAGCSRAWGLRADARLRAQGLGCGVGGLQPWASGWSG